MDGKTLRPICIPVWRLPGRWHAAPGATPKCGIAVCNLTSRWPNRYNYINPAMRTGGGAFIIMHKSSIEQNALLLLTCVSATGATLWEVSTGYGSAPLIYKDDVADRLYLAGDAGGGLSDELNQVLAIDLKSGAVQKYSIK